MGSAELTHCLVTRTTVPQMGQGCVPDPPTEKRLTVELRVLLVRLAVLLSFDVRPWRSRRGPRAFRSTGRLSSRNSRLPNRIAARDGFSGIPWLIGIGIWYALHSIDGRLERPAQVAAVWANYLGLILILHGIFICFDTPLAGAHPTIAQKRIGNRLAHLGGAIALVSVILAYAVDLRRRGVAKRAAKAAPLDDLAV